MLSTKALFSSSLLLLQLLGLISAEKFFTKAQVDPTSWADGLPTAVSNIRSICQLARKGCKQKAEGGNTDSKDGLLLFE